MGIISYAFFAYGVTAVLSLAVTGIIVTISKLTGKSAEETGEDSNE